MSSPCPDEAYGVALAALPMMGPARLRALLARWTPAAAWAAVAADRALDDHIVAAACGRDRHEVRAVWARVAKRIEPARELQRSEQAGIAVHLLGRAGYPPELAADAEAPAVCFVKGEATHLASPARVAIIGTRSATAPGLELAHRLGHDLAAAGVSIVSGLARGIDAAAHRGALAAAAAASDRGGGQRARRRVSGEQREGLGSCRRIRGAAFRGSAGRATVGMAVPRGNRLIACLADIVVVVESRASGGSMLTVKEAILRGRQVMAVPGAVSSAASEGTNQLIYDGCCPVRDSLDVLVALGLTTASRGRGRVGRQRPKGDDGRLFSLLDAGTPLDLETLARNFERSLAETALALDRLEAQGWVERNGAWWQVT